MVETGVTNYACLSFSIPSFREITCNSYFLSSAGHKNLHSPHADKLWAGQAAACSISVRHTEARVCLKERKHLPLFEERMEGHALPPEAVKTRSFIHFFPLWNREKRLQDLLCIQSEREEKEKGNLGKGKSQKNTPNTCKLEAEEKFASWGSEKKIEKWRQAKLLSGTRQKYRIQLKVPSEKEQNHQTGITFSNGKPKSL